MLRVLTIGIDGCSWNVVEKLRNTEILSMNFIKRETAWGILESTVPPWSVPAWNTLFTGVRPEKMRLYSFVKRRGNSLAPALRELDNQVYVWDLVSMHGGRVVAVNVPCVSRAIPVNGYFVSGFLADRSKLAFPLGLNGLLSDYGYIVDVYDLHPLTDEEYLEVCIKATIQETALFLELSRRVKWVLGILVYTHSDRVQHRFLKTRFSFVEKYYEVLDACIAKLLDSINLDNTVVFIVSDHGFKIPKTAFNVNTWFASKGYLSINPVSTRTRVMRTIKYKLSNNYTPLTIARKVAKLCPTLSKALSQTKLENREGGPIKGAYMPSEDGSVYIMNVTDEVKNMLVDKIAEEIGKNIPKIKVCKASEVYEVVRDEAPDLVLESDDYALLTDPTLPLRLRIMRATHAKEGVLIVLGPKWVIDSGFKSQASVYDIAPTMLYTLGIPIPSYMDGHVLTELFSRNFIQHNMKSYIEISYEKAKIKTKIRRTIINRVVE